MHVELYFAEQKTGNCCFMQINVSPHHVEFSSVFLKVIYIYIITEFWSSTLHISKSKTKKKQHKQPFLNGLQVGALDVKSCEIHRKVPVSKSQANLKKLFISHHLHCKKESHPGSW